MNITDKLQRNAGIAAITTLLVVFVALGFAWIGAAIDPTFEVPNTLVIETPWAVALVAVFALTTMFAFLAWLHARSPDRGTESTPDTQAAPDSPEPPSPDDHSSTSRDSKGDYSTSRDAVTTVGEAGQTTKTQAEDAAAAARADENFPDDLRDGDPGNEHPGTAATGQTASSPNGPMKSSGHSEIQTNTEKSNAGPAASIGDDPDSRGRDTEEGDDEVAGSERASEDNGDDTAENATRFYRNRSTRVVHDDYKR